MAVDFTRTLQDPQNKTSERAGTPAVDNSKLIDNIGNAGQAAGNVFDGLKVNQANQVRSATTQALYASITPQVDATTALIQNHPQVQALANTATSVQQGNSSPMALAIQKVAVTKELNNQFPGYADVVDSQIHRVAGTTGYQDFVKQSMAPAEQAQEQQKQLVDSAISKGTVVLGKGGQIDTQASIQALIQHNASEQRATSIQQNYENGVHSQDMYDRQMGSELVNNIHERMAQTFNNAVNSPEFQQIKAIPDAGTRNVALQNWFNHFQGTFEASTDAQISSLGQASGPNANGAAGLDTGRGLSVPAQKAIQEQRTSIMDSYKKIVLDGVSPMEAVDKLATMAKNQGQLEAWRTHPEILQTVENLGGLAPAIISDNTAVDSTRTSLIGYINASLGGTGQDGLNTGNVKYTPPSQKWLDNISFTNKITTNPNTLPAAVSTGDNTKVPVAVNTARQLATNVNNNNPKQDLAYNNVNQNLSGLALSGKLNPVDLRNNIKELTQPVHINALLQSKAKQYNSDAVDKSINDTVRAINMGLLSIPQALTSAVSNKQLQIDPNTGELQVDSSLFNTQTRLGRGGISSPSLQDTTTAQNIVSNAKTYNQAVDAYIKLKANTPYKNIGDSKIRELLNLKYLPSLAPQDEAQGGSSTPTPASSSSGGTYVDVPNVPVKVTPPNPNDGIVGDGIPASGGE